MKKTGDRSRLICLLTAIVLVFTMTPASAAGLGKDCLRGIRRGFR